MHQTFKISAIASTIAVMLLSSGCASLQPQLNALEVKATRNIVVEQEKATLSIPVVATTAASWLMGPVVQVAPTPSPILTRIVTYAPQQSVELSDVASWISQKTGLVIDTAEVELASSDVQTAGQTQMSAFAPPPVVPSLSAPGMIPGMNGTRTTSSSSISKRKLLAIKYEGPLSGLLDDAANKAGVWWKFADGRISFFRTETKTFYLPAIANKSTGNSAISTNSGSSGGAGTKSDTAGGAASSSVYQVDVWGDLEKTAKTVAGSAQVVANASTGSLTVTGTPTQVRNVEEWVKNLSDNLSQQVAITVHVYKVKVTNEENYNWNPSVVFNNLSAKYGLTLTGPQAPPTVSGIAPLDLAVNVLKTATGTAAQYTGTQLAYQALSTLGRVTETVQQTVVTLNGQPAPLQVASQTTYLASTTPGAATAIGAAPVPPTLTPGTITTGFTAMFLPRIVNGKILLVMNLTSSTLVALGTIGSGGSSIQTPNVDLSTFQQSVSLTPGDALLLTGLQKDNGTTNRSGVGSPNNFAFGGGLDDNVGKQLIAIVITAKVL